MTLYHPEENMWAAVIQQAIRDALSKPTSVLKAHAIRESRDWLLKPNSQFDYVCELAGKNPARTRLAIGALLAKQEERNVKPPHKAATKREHATLTFHGKTQTIGQWATERGLTYGMIAARLRNGWTVEAALSTPFTPSGDRFKLYSKRNARAGARSDFGNTKGTGGGSTAQDFPETEFSYEDFKS